MAHSTNGAEYGAVDLTNAESILLRGETLTGSTRLFHMAIIEYVASFRAFILNCMKKSGEYLGKGDSVLALGLVLHHLDVVNLREFFERTLKVGETWGYNFP